MIPVQTFKYTPLDWDWDNECPDFSGLFNDGVYLDTRYRFFNRWHNMLVITSWRPLVDGQWAEPVYEYPYPELWSGKTADGEPLNLVGNYYACDRWQEEAIPF